MDPGNKFINHNYIIKSYIMKRPVYSLTSLLLLVMSHGPGSAQVVMEPDSVTMTPGYANEVYYHFATGTKYSVQRNTWDIAFRTMQMSSSILTNDGAGVVLWTYPNADTSGWGTIDTTGLSTWTPMYNDPDDWENGAFSRHASGHPDYGWGVYNMATHVITGDSLFIIKLTGGNFRKLWIIEKDAPANIFRFRYANLDGTGLQEITLDNNPYKPKDFVGFSLETSLAVDYQPLSGSWDILFTKYMSVQPSGEPYPVTGVLSSPLGYAKRYYPVDPDYNDWAVAPWDSSRSTIGWDWKVFDMNQFVYIIKDSMVFYVKDTVGDVYRLKFTSFSGSSTGNINFGKARVSSLGIASEERSGLYASLYPNPAEDVLYVDIRTLQHVTGEIAISIFDITGRNIRSLALPEGVRKAAIPLNDLVPGAYLLVLSSGKDLSLNKFLKR